MEEEVGYMRRTGRRSRIYEKKKMVIWEKREEKSKMKRIESRNGNMRRNWREDSKIRRIGREESKMRRIESRRW